MTGSLREPGVGADDGWRVQPRGGGGLRELAAELAEDQVLAALLDEGECGGIPERGGAAVAEHDLVAVGDAEQLAEAILNALHQVLHRSLPVGGAEQFCAHSREVLELFRSNLGWSAAESSVGGQQGSRGL
jgi:hypothetical protein